MDYKANQPSSNEPTVAVSELVEGELDQIVGGAPKKTEKKKDKKKSAKDYLVITFTDIVVTA